MAFVVNFAAMSSHAWAVSSYGKTTMSIVLLLTMTTRTNPFGLDTENHFPSAIGSPPIDCRRSNIDSSLCHEQTTAKLLVRAALARSADIFRRASFSDDPALSRWAMTMSALSPDLGSRASPDHSRALRMMLAEVLGGGRALRSATDLLECARGSSRICHPRAPVGGPPVVRRARAARACRVGATGGHLAEHGRQRCVGRSGGRSRRPSADAGAGRWAFPPARRLLRAHREVGRRRRSSPSDAPERVLKVLDPIFCVPAATGHSRRASAAALIERGHDEARVGLSPSCSAFATTYRGRRHVLV